MSQPNASPDNHVRRFLLERLCANETFDERALVESHVQVCELCAERLLSLRTELLGYSKALPQETFMQVLEQRMRAHPQKHWNWRWLIAPVTAACLAAVAIVLLQREAENPGEDTQWRGASVTFLRERDGAVVVLHHGDKVREGDRLSLVARSNRQASLRLRILEERAGAVTYYPSGGAVLVEGETTFPGSIVVTPPCQDMTLTLITTSTDVAVADPLRLGCD